MQACLKTSRLKVRKALRGFRSLGFLSSEKQKAENGANKESIGHVKGDDEDGRHQRKGEMS